MTDGRGNRRLRRIGRVAAAASVLGATLIWNGPAQAVAHKGLNGLIVCGGTKNIGSTSVVDFEVFVMNPDGTGRTSVTAENPITDYNPLWTPDGTKILYESERPEQAIDDTFELYLMNPDGSGKTLLLANGKTEDIPKGCHPDGSQLAMSSNRDGNSEIYKMNADATDQVRLTNNAANDNFPRWSPDGTKIIFVSNRSGNNEIWSMDPFGGSLVNVTNNAASDSTPEWSPDGTKILFTRNLAGSGNETFAMNDDGSNVRRLTNSFDFDGRCDWQRLCTITGTGTITGTEGDDVICGGPGDDRIAGLGGNDILLGFGGNDSLSGGPGNDTLFGGLGTDSLVGGTGVDFSSAGPGADRISADAGERIDIGAGTGDQCVIGGVIGCPARLS